MFPWLRFLAVCLGLMMFYVGFRQGRWDAFHVYLNGVDIPCKTSPTLRGVDSKGVDIYYSIVEDEVLTIIQQISDEVIF